MIGNYLKNLRKRQNIKVVELAKTVQVSQPYISNIENEKRYPTKDLFFKIIISIAELSPLNYEVYRDLELSKEQKKDIYIPDVLPEFWEKYSSTILKNINEYLDDEDEITSFEDFKDYVSSWNIEDMAIFPEFTDFLDSKYGQDDYGEFLDYKDYSSYQDPEYIKSIVTDYWYQDFLTEFLDYFENTSTIDGIPNPEYTEIMLETLAPQELEIYTTIKELQHRKGIFDRYQFKNTDKNNLTDLSIIDDSEAIYKLTLDGKHLSSADIIALQTLINGIRYKR